MRKLSAILAVLFAACTVFTVASGARVIAAGPTHEAAAEVVSVDVQAKTITIKTDKGEEKTAPVIGKALDELKNIKAGDKVTLTCEDNEKGEHLHVTMIKKAQAK